jgi:outer membrane protein assembly factor BamB
VAGSGGGIWSYGGLSADSAGNIFTATGDSNQVGGGHAGYSEHVVKLSYKLKVRSSNFPHLPGRDADFGATPLLYHAPGCPPELAVGNKYGSFFVYDRRHIGRGPVQRIGLGGSIRGQKALLGVAAYSPKTNMVYTMNPRHHGKYKPGVVAFRVTKKCHLSKAWNAAGPGKLQSSPTIANGVLYYGNGGRGDVVAFNAQSGKRLARFHIGAPIFAAPTVVNGRLYVSAWDGRVYKYALP